MSEDRQLTEEHRNKIVRLLESGKLENINLALSLIEETADEEDISCLFTQAVVLVLRQQLNDSAIGDSLHTQERVLSILRRRHRSDDNDKAEADAFSLDDGDGADADEFRLTDGDGA